MELNIIYPWWSFLSRIPYVDKNPKVRSCSPFHCFIQSGCFRIFVSNIVWWKKENKSAKKRDRKPWNMNLLICCIVILIVVDIWRLYLIDNYYSYLIKSNIVVLFSYYAQYRGSMSQHLMIIIGCNWQQILLVLDIFYLVKRH